MKTNKKNFTVKIDDKEVELSVVRPSYKVTQDAGLRRSKVFAECIKNGAILRTELDKVLRDRGLWSNEKQLELDELDKKLDDNLLKLQGGGMKLSEGRKIALEIKKLRGERSSLLSERVSLDGSTAEGQAEQESLAYIVSRCIVNEEGQPFYKTYEDYLENRSSDVSRKGFSAYIELISDINTDFENSLPENKFLLSYNFINKDGRFINKEGKLTDVDGRLVDEKGRWINENGETVDKEGRKVDDDGNYVVESKPFLDEDGNPLS